MGNLTGAVMLGLSALCIASYYRQEDFLNKSYLLPYREIAEIVNDQSAGVSATLIADTWNTDPSPLADLLSKQIETIIVTRNSTEGSIKETVRAKSTDIVWYFRNTHDTSPDALNTRLETYFADGRRVTRRLFVPYSERDKLVMRLLGWAQPSTHLIQLLDMRRNAAQ
jgi:hypothetical protein